MSADDVDFLPRSKVVQLRENVNSYVVRNLPTQSTGKRLTPIERAELLEVLGTIEFYEGNWLQCVQALQPSLSEYEEVSRRRSPPQLVSSHILVRRMRI